MGKTAAGGNEFVRRTTLTTPVPAALAALFLMAFGVSVALAGGDDGVPGRVKGTVGDEPGSPAEIFDRRIMPIFRSAKPSSCVECHLSGVDLKNYILDTPEKTFISLRDQGLIDLDKPESSRILEFIRMGDDAKDPSLIQDSMRSQEYHAFAEWIVASCKQPALRNAPKLRPEERAGPSRPPEVIRHARADRVLATFDREVWSQRFRCTSCHAPGGSETTRLVKEQGTDDFLWLQADPATTMRNMIEAGFVDVERPERSLLLRKPTNQVKHGGGKKMEVGDAGYKAFRAWVEDYARTVGGQYRQAGDLPPVSTQQLFATDHWFKIENTPAQWADKLLQVSVHAYDERAGAWHPEPLATSDRGVWGKGKLWQHNLIAVATRGSERAANWQRAAKPTLPPGRYLIKVFVDVDGRLTRDWKASMDEREFVGEYKIQTDWPSGNGKMTVVRADEITNRTPPAPRDVRAKEKAGEE